MKVDYYYPPSPPEFAAEAAREASDLGYDGFFTAETQHDPFFPINHAAQAVPDMDFGTAIAVAFPRSPASMAMTAWDLARQTNGRFKLGLGTQVRAHVVRRFSSYWSGKPAPQLREYIQAMRAVWDCWQNGTPLRYEGEFYKINLMTPFFNPGPIKHPHVPVYIAGVGPYLSALAGEVCDGFHVHPFHTVAYLDDVVFPAMSQAATEAGRSLDDIEMVTTIFLMTGENEEQIEQAKAAARQQISFYASTPSYGVVLEASGWDFGSELHAMSKRGEWDKMPDAVPDEALEAVGIIATYDNVADAIKERYGDRIQRVGFYSLGSTLFDDKDALRQVISDLHS